MTKILGIISNTNIDKYDSYVDGFIFGLKDYSVNLPNYVSLNEIKNINTDKEIFIAINKNIYSRELEELKNILKELDKLNIKGILFADTCLIMLKKKLNLNIDLVWSGEHLTTNYETINNWYDEGVKYTYLSSDITLREIKEIKENTNSILIVPIFGYIPIFTSLRHEVKNYLDNFNLEDNSKLNYIEKEGKTYPIVDNKEGTVVYSNSVLNGYAEYLNLDIDYVTINSFNIEDSEYINVLKAFKEKKEKDLIFENSDKGFLYKETIYKVK